MKFIILVLALLFLTCCTIFDRNIDIYSNQLRLEKDSKFESNTTGPIVEKNHCDRIILFIPLSSKNIFEVADDLIIEHSEYNGLMNMNIKSDMFSLLPIYASFCHTIKGQLVKINKK